MSARAAVVVAVAWWGLTAAVGAPLAQAADLGQPAPDFTLPDLAGKAVRLGDFRARKAVLINFWATWCLPCRDEMPTLERVARERSHSLEVFGVNLDTIGKERVQEFVRELGLTFPILLDPEAGVGRRYRIRALPASFLVDRDGIVRYREIGYRDWTTPESRSLLDQALRPR